MGFTGFVYDMTLPAVAASRQFVRENGDILAHHIEGVPWAEAMLDEPFPDALLNEWRDKKLATPPNGRVYLAVSPGRGELKPADKAGPVPPELRGKAYDHPLVKNAFLNYCRRGIEFFEPDYLGIGIEVNEIYSSSPAKWRAYVDLHKHVYRELKKSHPQLPIFASFTLHNTYKERGPMLTEFQALMPFNDLVAVSYYPFIVGGDGRLRALDWMTEQFDRFDKPYAIVETNDAAERLTFPQAGFVIEGTPEGQLEYYRKLLSMAQQRKFEFVISFIHQDYDALWERIKNQSPEMFMAWRDCGLLDQDGNARPAYDLWHGYFQLKQTAPSTRQTPLQLQLRRRVGASKDNGQYKIENRRERWNPDETAIIICDMWDDHTCRGAAARVAEIAPAIGRTVKAAREQGVFIIHAPSGCMSFYEGTPQRDRALEATPATAPVEIKWNQWNKEREGEPLADIVDGGCSCPKPCPNFRVDDDGVRHWIKGGKIPWARQIKSIEIGTQDAISDSGQEIHNLLEQRGIDNVILMGVHTNICVSGRPFGLRQMVYFGKNVVLCRDLTDALFQSPSAGIDQFRGTDLVVEHIEKHICPTITSASITGQAEFRFQANTVNRQ
jgi:nicotinamidase-related amidase